MAQTIQMDGETWVLDGNRYVKKSVIDEWRRRGVDLLNAENPTPEMIAARDDNSIERSAATNRMHAEKTRGGVGQKGYRQNLHNEYGKEQGNKVFDQHVAWAREAEAQGADPSMVDFLYFQEGVLLPGGLIADYTGGDGHLRIQDLQGNIVQATPELEQQAKQKHIEVYGSKYGSTGGGGGTTPPPTTTGGPTGVATPQMHPPRPSSPPNQAPAPGAPTDRNPPTTGQQPGTDTAPAPGQGTTGTRPPSPPAPPPATTPGSSGRSPYPGMGTPRPGNAAGVTEQPGLGGAAAPSPTSATQGQASATTPPAPDAKTNTGPIKPGLSAQPTGGGLQPGLAAPAAPAQPPPANPGQGGAGAVAPPAAPPPARSPYPTGAATQQPQQPQPQQASPYPGYPSQPPPQKPPRTVALPGSMMQFGVQMPTLTEGQHFFDPFSGKFV